MNNEITKMLLSVLVLMCYKHQLFLRVYLSWLIARLTSFLGFKTSD